MSRIEIFPLDAELARRLATQRGISVAALLSNLLREDAALTILGLRNTLHRASNHGETRAAHTRSDLTDHKAMEAAP
jgi:hypothetical protein